MFYIAGKYNAQERLRAARDRLRAQGFVVEATWLDVPDQPYTEEELDQHALRDVQDVKAANNVIVDTLDPSDTGGREVEFGLALGDAYKNIFRIGPERNIFHRLAHFAFPSWEAFFAHLEELS